MKKLILQVVLGLFAFQASAVDVNIAGQVIAPESGEGTYDVYTFTSTSDPTMTRLKQLSAVPNAGGVRVDNRYYCFSVTSSDWSNDYSIYIYDMDDDFNLITKVTASSYFMTEGQVVAYDPTTEKIYVAYKNSYDYKLATLDLSSRLRSDVATIDTYTPILAMAFAPDGELYAVTTYGYFYKLNKATGDMSYIGQTGVSAEYEQSMVFSPDGTLYWAACAGDITGGLYTIDLATGRAIRIKDFPNDEEFASLWITSVVVSDQAPAAATGLQAVFEGGSTSGNILFKAPETTHGGSPLNGGLSYEVKIDGKKAAEGTTVAGADVVCPVSTTQGMHDFSVVLFNEAGGEGDEAAVKGIYIGKDVPDHVTGVSIVRGEATNELILTWVAPTVGIHGGYLDLSEIKYRVRRLPDFEVVSENATSPFSDVVESATPIRCSYEVTPYIDQNTQGLGMTSNSLMIGTPFAIPYSEDFSINDNTLAYTIEDTDQDGKLWTWDYDFKFFKVWNNETTKDDWIFVPYIQFEQGVTYTLQVDVRSLGIETMEIKIGTDAASQAMTAAIAAEFTVNTDSDWETKKFDFSVPSTAPWFIGFHATAQEPDKALALYIDNIVIDKKSSSGISDLSAADAKVSVKDRCLSVEGCDAVCVEVFSVDGTRVASAVLGSGRFIELAPGIYVVRYFDRAVKVAVR